MLVEFRSENLQERGYYNKKFQGVDGRILLKWGLESMTFLYALGLFGKWTGT